VEKWAKEGQAISPSVVLELVQEIKVLQDLIEGLRKLNHGED
jgi:hypothetical protein